MAGRLPWLQPGSDNSVWNTPIGSGAVWNNNSADPAVIDLRHGNYVNCSYFGSPCWVGTASDPVVQYTSSNQAQDIPLLSASIHTPSNAIPATGGDNQMTLWDQTTPTKMWCFSNCTFNNGTNVLGGVSGWAGEINDPTGVCEDQVTGKWGYTVGLGTIRTWELDPAQNPSLRIGHMLRYATSNQLLFTTTTTHTASTPLPWPTTHTDGDALNVNGTNYYSGHLQAGVTIGIPASVAMPSGLTQGGQILWRCLQEFGALWRDVGGNGVTFYGEAALETNPLMAGMRTDMAAICSHLAILTNQGPNSKNGGGTPLTARPTALDPAYGGTVVSPPATPVPPPAIPVTPPASSTVQINFNTLTSAVADARIWGVSTDQTGAPYNYSAMLEPQFLTAASQLNLTALRLNWNTDTMNGIYPTQASVANPDWTWVDNFINHVSGMMTVGTTAATGNIAITLGWPNWLDYTVSGNYTTYTTMCQKIAQHFKDNGCPVFYWELTNEPDNLIIGNVCSMFTAMRTGIKAVDSTYKCGGLSNSYYHGNLETTFVQTCTVDFISVHEYYGNGESLTISWPDAVTKALSTGLTYSGVRADMTNAGLSSTAPIWVSEFNWDGSPSDLNTGQNGIRGAVYWALRTAVVAKAGNVQMMGRRALLNDNEYGAITGSSGNYTVLTPGYAIAKLGSISPGTVVISSQSAGLANLFVLPTVRAGVNTTQLINYDQTTTYSAAITGFSGTTVSYWEMSTAHPNGYSQTIALSTLNALSIPPMSIIVLSSSVATPIPPPPPPAPPPTPVSTWNASDKDASIVLSGSNMTATTVGAVNQTVRSTTSKSSGKFYFEVKIVTRTNDFAVGISNTSFVSGGGTELGGSIYGVGYYPVSPPQSVYFNDPSIAISLGTASDVNNAVVSIAVDFTNKLIWCTSPAMRTQAGNTNTWNNSSTANPATGVGGLSFSAMAGPYFVTFNDDVGGAVALINFGLQTFARTLPTGFAAWDTAVVAPPPAPVFPPPPVPPPVIPIPPTPTPVPPPLSPPPTIPVPPPVQPPGPPPVLGPPITDLMTAFWTAMTQEISANQDLFFAVNIVSGDPQGSTGQADYGVFGTPAAAVIGNLFKVLPTG